VVKGKKERKKILSIAHFQQMFCVSNEFVDVLTAVDSAKQKCLLI